MTGATYSRLVELRRLLIKTHVKAQIIKDGSGDAAITDLLETAADKILDALRLAGTAETLAQDALRETYAKDAGIAVHETRIEVEIPIEWEKEEAAT